MKTREPLQFWIDNILKAYALATPADRAEGLTWYDKARTFCADLADRRGLSVDLVAGVLAALSPATSWVVNLRDAEAYLLHGDRATVSTYGPNKNKARRIARGGDPEMNLGKFKTLSFFRCIVGRRDVCIDRHAAAIAYGRALTDQERGAIKGVTYERLQNAYYRAADAVALTPAQLQAVTWVYWRRLDRSERLRKLFSI